jgi:hypothetical protein
VDPPLDLHDIVVPEPVSLVPQAIGWWIVAAVLLAAMATAGVAIVRHRAANRYRREALARLHAIEAELAEPGTRVAAAGRLPELVKRTALTVRPRPEVASLSGAAWLDLLDESSGGRDFRDGPGRLLPTLAYAKPADLDAIPVGELRSLVKLVERWIRRHRVRV